ncbi:hypothetical protein [Klebsiella pneumoniae]|uniref:hypothetical protein n=1 Tax=Klebsiella pneumoniae TaxID=573 RepID=UPI003F677806
MNHVNINRKLIALLYIALILFACTSVFSLLAVKLDFMILKIWKEITIIGCYIVAVTAFIFKRKYDKKLFFFIIILPIYIIAIYLLTTLDDNRTLVFYEMKSDIVPFLFPLAFICLIDNNIQATIIYKKICKILVGIGIINCFLIFVQRMFSSWFLVLLQIDDMNNQQGASGLRLDNVHSGLRAMGSMTSFINSGTLMILCIFIIMESGYYNRLKKILYLPLFIVATVMTTYKTALVGLAIYIISKLIIIFLRGNINKKIAVMVFTFVSFIAMATVFNTMYLYDKIKNGDLKQEAYNSIYLRVIQHNDIFNDVANKSILTGVGIGVNGTTGPAEEKIKYRSKPLDSQYISLLSNYGMLGIVVYLVILIVIMVYCVFRNCLGSMLSCFLIFYHIGIEFFANNMLPNFPINVYFSVLICFSLFYKEEYENTKLTNP